MAILLKKNKTKRPSTWHHIPEILVHQIIKDDDWLLALTMTTLFKLLLKHSPFFFFCCFFDFIFRALLSISTAVFLWVKPLRTTGTQSYETKKKGRSRRKTATKQKNHAGGSRRRTMTVIYHSSRIFSECLEKPLITDAEAGDLLLEDRNRLAEESSNEAEREEDCSCSRMNLTGNGAECRQNTSSCTTAARNART